MEDPVIDRDAMGKLAKALAFICSPVAFSVSGEAISAAGGWGASAHL